MHNSIIYIYIYINVCENFIYITQLHVTFFKYILIVFSWIFVSNVVDITENLEILRHYFKLCFKATKVAHRI